MSEAEGLFHVLHPRAAARQQAVAEQGDDHQRNAHPQRVQVQRTAAGPQVTALGDIQQDGAERRGGAGRANQPGQGAHQEHAGQRAAALGVAPARQPGLQRRGQLQGIEAEHRQRQRDKQHRQADQHVRVLQRRLELQAGGGHHQPQQGVGERHALHVNHRQRQNAAAALRPVAAEDDAGNQRVHRQHARGEGDADTDQQRPQRRERQAGRRSGLFGWCGVNRRERGGRAGADRVQRDDPGFRRIAEAGLGAALIGDAEGWRWPPPVAAAPADSAAV